MTTPQRGGLTTWLFQGLSEPLSALDPPVLLGDGIAPADGGWTAGQPGKGDFRAYGVLKTLTATPPRTQPVGDEDAAWVFPYSWTGWGAVREQADYACDQLLAALAGLSRPRGEESPIPGYGIQLLQVTSIGTTDRTDQTAPPMWSRTDAFAVRVARARTR